MIVALLSAFVAWNGVMSASLNVTKCAELTEVLAEPAGNSLRYGAAQPGAGGAGCITANANLISASLRTIFEHASHPAHAAEVETAHQRVTAYRNLAMSYVQIPAVKAMLAHKTGNPGWRRVRPPLMPLEGAPSLPCCEEFSYPSIIEALDGSLEIAFTYFRRAMKHVRLDRAATAHTLPGGR